MANLLEISCNPGLIELVFKNQPTRPGYDNDKDVYSSVHIPIRLYRTWSDTNLFKEFFEKLPSVIDKENGVVDEKSDQSEGTGFRGRSLSYHCRNGKKYRGNK